MRQFDYANYRAFHVPVPTSRKAVLAGAVWRSLFDFIVITSDHRNRVLQQLGLTPNDSRALSSLEPDQGRTMSSLAASWRVDASTATWIIDRLERRGLVKRQAVPTDRRVTLVLLTPRGVKTKAQLMRGVYKPPPELLTLDEPDLLALRDATAKLPSRSGNQPESTATARPARSRRKTGA